MINSVKSNSTSGKVVSTLKKGYSAIEIIVAVVVLVMVAGVAFYASGGFGTSLSGTFATSNIVSEIDATNLKTNVIDKQKVLDVASLAGDTTDTTAKTLTFEAGSSATFTGALTKGILVARVAPSTTQDAVGASYDSSVFTAIDRANPSIYIYSVEEIDSKVGGLTKLGTGTVAGVTPSVFVYKIAN